MVTTSRILTIAVFVLGIAALVSITYAQFVANQNSYNREISITFSKSPAAFDFTCKTNDYQIYFVLKNLGSKAVTGLSISITNPLCEVAIPLLPKTLNASSSISFEAQTEVQNGTLTVSGNNTFVQVGF
jgi:hypothetical protein